MSPLISVILPARNAATTLGLALRSVLAQTCPDFEVLVLDDGSTDATAEIAQATGDTRVRVLSRQGDPGLAARLNQGIDAARGTYIARMDADDVCFPERFERQVAKLESDPSIDLLGCRAVGFTDDSQVLGLLPFRATHERICARPWLGFYLPHPTWFGRADWFRRHRYRIPEVVRAEDQELLLRAMPDSRYAALPDVLLGYRCRPVSRQQLLRARTSLVAAQIKIFAARTQYINLNTALMLYAARLVNDTARRVASRTRPWPQTTEPATAEVVAQLQAANVPEQAGIRAV